MVYARECHVLRFNDDSFLEYFIISNGCSLIGEKSPRSNLMET